MGKKQEGVWYLTIKEQVQKKQQSKQAETSISLQEIYHERFKKIFIIYKARWNWVSNYATEAKLQ